MNKFLKLLTLSIASITAVCVCVGCTGDSGTTSFSSSSGGISDEYTYNMVNNSPDYAQVDFTDYTTYYFDAVDGDDNADGFSELTPKKSVSEMQNIMKKTTAEIPTRILIKAGSEYSGSLTIGGFTAAEETPFILNTYAVTQNIHYAKITSAQETTGVYIQAGNVRISGLEVTSEEGAGYRGFFVSSEKYGLNTNLGGVMKNVVISGNYVHDINFRWTSSVAPEDTNRSELIANDTVNSVCSNTNYSYGNGGIIFAANSSAYRGASYFENVYVENNIIERVARVGIWLDSDWSRRPGHDWGANRYYSDEIGYYPNRNVYVRGNRISFTGGDGVVIVSADGGYMENNVCEHASYLGRGGYYNAGLWIHSTQNYIMQYNEASYTHCDNGAGDGEGFDIDIGSKNIIFRYNYSHHNEGGGILLCTLSTTEAQYDENLDFIVDEDGAPITKKVFSPWNNVTLTNNIFAQNNNRTVQMTGNVNGITFANNVVYITDFRAANDFSVFSGKIFSEHRIFNTADFNGSGVPGGDWKFINNVYYLEPNSSMKNIFCGPSFCTEYTFTNNLMCNVGDDYKEKMGKNAINNKEVEYVGYSGIVKSGIEHMLDFKLDSSVLSGGIEYDKANTQDYEKVNAKKVGYYGAFVKAK